ncbi:MAG: serine/threonine-protein kinase [Fimbriimonadales bacterium]|nr:serine/threonine-protein kinase [Fimbriimonadales bacterium]
MALETVLGHYRIIREIARSNDAIYEAVDTRINRRVAIKELMMPPGATDAVRQDRIARFQREARAAGALTHPNIVTIFETEEENGRYFIVMEYLEGDNLRQKMDREGPLPPEEAVRIATQVLEGLAHAHSKGVIHRDIKPENIHILPTGLAKITDFGIARLKHEPNLTMDGQIFGTPSYMSPEQVQGGAIDERSDLFSVGIILYEMLAGYKPFQGDSVITITYNIVHTEPPSPPNIPAPLEWVIRKALRKNPAERFSSAEEMKQALAHALEQLKAPPVIATPLGPPPPYSAPAPTGGYPSSYPAPTGGYPAPYPTPAPSYPYPAPSVPTQVPAPSPTTVSAPAPYLPPPPPKPVLSPAARQFLGTLLGVMLIGGAILGVVILGVFSATRAYQEYQLQQIDAKVAARAKEAEKLFGQGRYREAAAIYAELYRSAQSNKWKDEFRRNTASALTMYGNQLLEARRYEEAMRAYQQAVQYAPLPEAFAGMAAIEAQLGNREGAVSHWASAAQHSTGAKAQEYQRQAARQQIAIGDEAYQRRDLQRALQAWQTAIELAPGTPEAREAQRKFDQALQELIRR